MSTYSPSTATQPPTIPLDASAAPAASSWRVNCLNCGSRLSGPFCSECGQRAVPPHPKLHELFGEAVAEFSGWDGKFAETLKLLVRRPGQLTLEFLSGRRARFISPLRLYLTSSVVFFLLATAVPIAKTTFIGVRPPPISVQKDNGPKQDPVDITPEERAEMLRQLDSSPRYLRPLIRQALKDPKQLEANILEAMPKALFALLPVFALILSLFYRGRRFADHLYFAIHLHAFVFVALILNDLVKFTRVLTLSVVCGLVVFLWLPVYAHLALRRVYGGSQLSTLAKELGISILYAFASIPAIVLLVVWVAARS